MTAQFELAFALKTCRVLVRGLPVWLALTYGCGGSESVPSSSNANGGARAVDGTSSGGVMVHTGGSASTPSTGGSGQSGGTSATGGQASLNTGGRVAIGGETTTGGRAPQGTGGKAPQGTGGQGPLGTGGSDPTGGKPNTGGQVGFGGQSGSASGGNGQAGSATPSGGKSGAAGSLGSCVPTRTWGTADPSKAGPFTVQVEKNIGPAAGVPDAKWNNEVPHFNLYRPSDLSQGYCHPIVTWANGTGDQPPTYEVLIKQLASHGFVVVASLSSQSAQGTPLPQIAGVDWMLQENENPSSPLYHHLDTLHIGATGHSQGGAATTMAGADPRITAIAPICGSRANITLHGPAALLCGGSDTMVPCSSVQTAYDSINNVPVMLFNSLSDTHGSWIGSIQNPFMVAVTGWMRVHLMGDTANRGMFYGASCKFCSDSRVKLQRKLMDN